jgi:hypothetical protein
VRAPEVDSSIMNQENRGNRTLGVDVVSVHQHRQSKTWSLAEKALFLRLVAPSGENLAALACLIPTKSESQIQIYLLNYKNRLGLKRQKSQSISGLRCLVYPTHALPHSSIISAGVALSSPKEAVVSPCAYATSSNDVCQSRLHPDWWPM